MSKYPNLLAQIRSLVPVDLDSMDYTVAERYVARSESFENMTSNQFFSYHEAIGNSKDVLKEAIKQVKARGINTNSNEFAEEVADLFTVLVIKKIYPYIHGKVHAQVSPLKAHDTQKTVDHAMKLVDLFALNGIPKDRVCIKIPSTVEALIACSRLSKMGIQTLGTCLFSIPQAIAASQAGCIHISPYLNELRAHFDKTLYKKYASPVTEHPGIRTIQSILDAYTKIQSKTLVIPASIVNTEEAIAMASIRPHRLTIFPGILEALEASPAVPADAFTAPEPPAMDILGIEKDYLANDGALLHRAIEADTEVTRKLEDSLVVFGQFEKDLLNEIERVSSTA